MIKLIFQLVGLVLSYILLQAFLFALPFLALVYMDVFGKILTLGASHLAEKITAFWQAFPVVTIGNGIANTIVFGVETAQYVALKTGQLLWSHTFEVMLGLMGASVLLDWFFSPIPRHGHGYNERKSQLSHRHRGRHDDDRY